MIVNPDVHDDVKRLQLMIGFVEVCMIVHDASNYLWHPENHHFCIGYKTNLNLD